MKDPNHIRANASELTAPRKDLKTRPKRVAERPYYGTYKRLFGGLPPTSVTRGESKASLFSPGRGFMDSFDLTMQLQVGCPGGCLFCYVPAGFRMTPAAVRGEQGRKWGFVVRDKTKALHEFQQRLTDGELADRTIYWSGITDPYAARPVLTREIWRSLCGAPQDQRPRRIAVQTRFRPDRDAELIAEYCRSTPPADHGPAVVVSYSLGTDREDLIRAWERATPSYRQRMRCIKSLCEAGLYVVTTLSPFGLWHDLQGTLEQLKQWGVPYITVLFFKNKGLTKTPRLFLDYLQNHHPELFEPSWQAARLQEMKSVFGRDRVLVGKEGFDTLAHPHLVTQTADQSPTSRNQGNVPPQGETR